MDLLQFIKMAKIAYILLLSLSSLMFSFSQAIEDIVVEEYFVSAGNYLLDGYDSENFITYRIYVDLAPGYQLQGIYGIPGNELRFETSTTFYNHPSKGVSIGQLQYMDRIIDLSVFLDSWLTIGAAINTHMGILKAEDQDGSLFTFPTFDVADGLIPAYIPPVVPFQLDLSCFEHKHNDSSFVINDALLTVFQGVEGPTEANRVLIAQLTTDGELSFEINMQVFTPDGYSEQYVARNPISDEKTFPGLIYGNHP